MFFRRQGIEGVFDAAIEEVAPGEVRLAGGRTLPFKYAMVVPPFVGADVVKASGLREPQGVHRRQGHLPDHRLPERLRRRDRHGRDRALDQRHAVGVPKTGFPAETMARVAAANIVSQIRGKQPTTEENFGDIPAVCIVDAGNDGVVILAYKMLPPRKHGVMIAGPQCHAAKVAFEKYFMWKARHGYVKLS